jgi:Lon protease-like protein
MQTAAAERDNGNMQPVLLPLFPLQVVLLPGSELPLHIFEDRYKEMMREVIRDRLEFGVVLANEKGIVNTGCTATVDQVLRQYPDGRMDLLTRGRRRFEIVRLNDERPFLRGSVDFFDDDESAAATPEIQKRAIDGYRQLQALSENAQLPEATGSEESPGAIDLPRFTEAIDLPRFAEAINKSDPQLSFRLAQPVPDLGFRQTLLATRSEAERLRQLADFLPAYLHRQRRIQHMKEVAPKNGHGAGHGTGPMGGQPGGPGHGPSGIE